MKGTPSTIFNGTVPYIKIPLKSTWSEGSQIKFNRTDQKYAQCHTGLDIPKLIHNRVYTQIFNAIHMKQLRIT